MRAKWLATWFAVSIRMSGSVVIHLPDRIPRPCRRCKKRSSATTCSTWKDTSSGAWMHGEASEHAVWDAIGRIAGSPFISCWAATVDSLRVYLTTVWPGIRISRMLVTTLRQKWLCVKSKPVSKV